jgi:hypothetical protein
LLTAARRSRATRAATLLFLALLAALAARRVIEKSRFMVLHPEPAAAVDLRGRYRETRDWFAGEEVYAQPAADYPPATYAMLRPLAALPWPAARFAWWVVSMACLAALSFWARGVPARTGSERWLAIVLPWAMTATAVTLTAGQMGLAAMTAALGAIYVARRRPASPGHAAAAGALFALALIKPNVTVPFFWVLARAGSPLAAGCAVIAYAGLAVAACAAQERPWSELAFAWVHNGERFATSGYSNLAELVARAGAPGAVLPLAFVILAMLGWWVFRHREAPVWRLLGVTAAAARLWTYHYGADDVLMLPLILALWRLAATARGRERVWTRTVLALNVVLATLLPTRLFNDFGPNVRLAAGLLLMSGVVAGAWLLLRLPAPDGDLEHQPQVYIRQPSP